MTVLVTVEVNVSYTIYADYDTNLQAFTFVFDPPLASDRNWNDTEANPLLYLAKDVPHTIYNLVSGGA
jgi:hypothetical protein